MKSIGTRFSFFLFVFFKPKHKDEVYMINTIPLSNSDVFKSGNERIFIGLLWILTNHNTQEGFFLKEHIKLFGTVSTYNHITKKLVDRKIISYQVKGIGATKHRYFQIIDPEIIKEFSELTNTSKMRKKKKNSKSGTQVSPTDQKSILCNSDTDLRDIFISVAEKLYKENKIIVKGYMIANEIERFKKYYLGKQINDETVEKWLLKLKEFNKE